MLLCNVVLLLLPFTSQITRRTADFSSCSGSPGWGSRMSIFKDVHLLCRRCWNWFNHLPHSPKTGVREDKEVEILPLLVGREGIGFAGYSNNLWRLIFFTFLKGLYWHSCFPNGNFQPERLQRGGPCWLLKLRLICTIGVHMKGAFPWLVSWARCAVTRDFYPAMTALVGPVQIFFSSPYTFHFIYSYRLASWASSRAVSPVF